MEIPRAKLLAIMVPIIKRRSWLMASMELITMPNRTKVESNNVFMKNLRRIGPISLFLLSKARKPKGLSRFLHLVNALIND